LRVIETFRKEFPDVVVGYSGHDSGISMALLAYALGARIVEKHFTLNRAMKGTDHAFSLEPVGLRKLVRDLRRARIALGDGVKHDHASEMPARTKMGKQIVARVPLAAGHVLECDDVTMKSPGGGLWPYQLDEVLGRPLLRDVAADESITFDVVGSRPVS
jgi:N-acetylneuraminate synthase/sialic acid synthase